MTIIEKIKRSVEAATGLPFLYHAAGEINELIARAESLPVAFAFLLDSGTIDDVNGRYRERVTLAVMFADKSQFDFNALENEEIIDRMKIKAYKWLQSLRLSNDLNIVAINQTQRLYDATTDILTGFSVNVTIEDYAGYGECELPEVVFEIKANGEYDVVGIDKVLVNVLPQLEELTITQNGEYLPSDGVAGFSKVTAEFDTSNLPKVKVSALRVSNDCIDGETWVGELIDWSSVINMNSAFKECTSLVFINVGLWDLSNVTTAQEMFSNCRKLISINGQLNLSKKNTSLSSFCVKCYKLKSIDVSNFDTSNVNNFNAVFAYCHELESVDISSWSAESCSSAVGFNFMFHGCRMLSSCIGNRTIDDVILNNITCLQGMKYGTAGFVEAINLDRASLRAVINGLADLTGQTAQTLTLGAKLIAKLTEEDIAIATNKNWTIA